MIELKEEDKAALTEHAKSYLTLAELAEIMEIDRFAFEEEYNTSDSDIRHAVRKGRLLAKSEVYRSMQISAKNGSSPAQEKFMGIIMRTENGEL